MVIAVMVGLPLLIIVIVALVANHPDPSFSESYQYGHDQLGPVALQEINDAGIEGSVRACQLALSDGTTIIGADVGGRFVRIPRPPDSYDSSQGEKGCMTYVSEHTDPGAKWWENPR